jgi:predicted RNA binding protein YcfA (HicA-like mRNA interferase family)
MPPQLKRLSSREVLRILGSFGFEVIRTRGSHAKLRRTLPGGERQTLTVPVHKALSPGTLHAIFRQASRFVSERELRRRFFSA